MIEDKTVLMPHATKAGSRIPAANVFFLPSLLFDDEGLRRTLSGNALKVYAFMRWQTGRPALAKDGWHRELGLSEATFKKALDDLVESGLLQRVWRHGCGQSFHEPPEGECPKCRKSTPGSVMDVFYRTVEAPVEAAEVTPEATVKPRKTASEKAAPKRTGNENPLLLITDQVQRLARLSGIPDETQTDRFWTKWTGQIKAMRQRLEGTPYGDADIIRALTLFYNAGYSFENPHYMTTDLIVALTGKLKPKKAKQTRQVLHVETVRQDAPDGAEPLGPGWGLENRYGR